MDPGRCRSVAILFFGIAAGLVPILIYTILIALIPPVSGTGSENSLFLAKFSIYGPMEILAAQVRGMSALALAGAVLVGGVSYPLGGKPVSARMGAWLGPVRRHFSRVPGRLAISLELLAGCLLGALFVTNAAWNCEGFPACPTLDAVMFSPPLDFMKWAWFLEDGLTDSVNGALVAIGLVLVVLAFGYARRTRGGEFSPESGILLDGFATVLSFSGLMFFLAPTYRTLVVTQLQLYSQYALWLTNDDLLLVSAVALATILSVRRYLSL